MGFPQGLSAFVGGSGGQGWTRQPVLPEIPTEVLWFILHLKVRGGNLKSTRLQDIWDKRVAIVSVWPTVTLFRHVLKQILHNGDNRADKIPVRSFLQREKQNKLSLLHFVSCDQREQGGPIQGTDTQQSKTY